MKNNCQAVAERMDINSFSDDDGLLKSIELVIFCRGGGESNDDGGKRERSRVKNENVKWFIKSKQKKQAPFANY